MKKFVGIFILCTFIGSIFWACNHSQYDSTYGSNFQNGKQFYPMQVGATQLYRLDSTAPTAFGVSLAVNSYLLKDSVSRRLLNALGDTTFEVYRFITDTLQAKPWRMLTTYRVVYTSNTVDVIQDDSTLRFIKLASPVINGLNWNGNRYFVPYNGNGSVNDTYYAYEDWNYIYDSVGMPFTTAYDATYPNTITVNEVNSSLYTGDFDPTRLQIVKYSEEVYALNVGLVYQNMLFYIYQPSGSTKGYDSRSFGIKITRLQ